MLINPMWHSRNRPQKKIHKLKTNLAKEDPLSFYLYIRLLRAFRVMEGLGADRRYRKEGIICL